jgi:predicted transposase YdaD
MGGHDHAYKILFAHPRMVRDLLEGFVNGEWLSWLNFDTLERVSDNHVSDDLRSRADDIVWRIRCCDRDVYLLIEFQSTNDPFMAVRVLTYEGLLYQDLIRTQKVECGDPLPAILPIVLYNGPRRWSAPEELASSFPSDLPGGLGKYVPQCRYLLIDESCQSEAALLLEGNAVAALFRLENCRQPEQIPAIVGDLMARLERAGQHSLRRAFRLWLTRVLFARGGKGADMANELWETHTMLSERVEQWEAEFLRKGRQEGLLEGRQEGEAAFLMRLLQKRFGELPSSVSDRIKAAQPVQLEQWGERLLEAHSLSELLDG